ncbi:hypothetical protein MFKK_09380 [Halopseudomonas aestusnigri]|jgi:hypothetical protein|nr:MULTISPECIES: hypothetical protein [Halopseudomonas]MAK73678.1 hypothetical protein [Pseudomonadales bacterium]BDX18128.1 hypothetical protein MFKK_09380 [Halopseudomonas aestusnigri]|tara:strand:- start:245 stop:760 length:516 start_codon:yes stop_codon:yes gene_type:complete
MATSLLGCPSMFFQTYLKQRTFTMRQLLTNNTLRYLCLLVLLILVLPEAHACRGRSVENKLFFTNLPDPLPDADVVAKVILLDVFIEDYRIGWATARVHQVIEAAEGVIEEGDVLTLKYPISSCGPWHKPGETGAIIAITGTDSDSSVVWFPYFYRESDDRTFAPETEFDW